MSYLTDDPIEISKVQMLNFDEIFLRNCGWKIVEPLENRRICLKKLLTLPSPKSNFASNEKAFNYSQQFLNIHLAGI